MKLFEVSFFTEDRSKRVMKEIAADTEKAAIAIANSRRQEFLGTESKLFVEVTATFSQFLELHHGFNQMVDAEVYANS